LGFPVGFAPDRSGTGHARHGGDRSNTDPELRLRHTSNLLHELTHNVRLRVATTPTDPTKGETNAHRITTQLPSHPSTVRSVAARYWAA